MVSQDTTESIHLTETQVWLGQTEVQIHDIPITQRILLDSVEREGKKCQEMPNFLKYDYNIMILLKVIK